MELNNTSVRDGGSLQEKIVTVGGSAWDCEVRSKMDSSSSQEALRRVWRAAPSASCAALRTNAPRLSVSIVTYRTSFVTGAQ